MPGPWGQEWVSELWVQPKPPAGLDPGPQPVTSQYGILSSHSPQRGGLLQPLLQMDKLRFCRVRALCQRYLLGVQSGFEPRTI